MILVKKPPLVNQGNTRITTPSNETALIIYRLHGCTSLKRVFGTILMTAQLVACGGGSGSTGQVASGSTGQVASGSTGQVASGSASISWTAPVARADGSPLSLAEIEGYRVYYGDSEGDYPNRIDVSDGTAVELTLSELPPGTHYFVMTTYDDAGRESVFSPVIVKTI